MKKLWKVLGIAAVAGIVVVVILGVLRKKGSASGDSPSAVGRVGAPGNSGKRKISPELLEILADPSDKGPVELMETDGKEWLVNRRNGYRYPVEDGIPIMLIEEGEKNKDTNLIRQD